MLLRWQHPELGMVSPGEFIPLAEEGRPDPPDQRMADRPCLRPARRLAGLGLDMGRISINLSADSLFEHSLVQFIDEQLQRTGVPAGNTGHRTDRGVLMQNADTAQNVIAQLRQRGIHISLDDFGTGFSSLGYLNRFSIDEIKIDRSFVIDLETTAAGWPGPGHHHLGHALGLSVVAEGRNRGPGRTAAPDRLRHLPGFLRPPDAGPGLHRLRGQGEPRDGGAPVMHLPDPAPLAPAAGRRSLPGSSWLPPCQPTPSTPST